MIVYRGSEILYEHYLDSIQQEYETDVAYNMGLKVGLISSTKPDCGESATRLT